MQRFLQGRIDLVRYLDNNPSVHYADKVLIISAVLSACASHCWPGQRIDQKRFIELLVKHSPDDYHTSWISVPSLLNTALINESETPYGKAGNETRIYCDDEIDLSLQSAIIKYPQVSLKNLKQHSYAYLIYERLRNGYSHEYWHGDSITHVPASVREARLSYIGRLSGAIINRMISFHLDYLITLADYHISILPQESCQPPSCWWIIDERKI